MNEPIRILSALLAGTVYAGLAAKKIIRIRMITRARDKNSEAFPSRTGNIVKSAKDQLRILRFDLIRLAMNSGLLLGFILSGLWPTWFSLFPSTHLMLYTASSLLFSITLLISIFVDWFPVRESCRLSGKAMPSFARFYLKQFAGILRIESVMAIIGGVLLVLEQTQISLIAKATISVLVILLFRGLQDILARHRKEKDTN